MKYSVIIPTLNEIRTAHRALIIFVRYPEPGKVKTRLAQSIGNDAATEFYKMCAEKIFAEANSLSSVQTYIFFADGSDALRMAQWIDHRIVLREQVGEDLGTRMSNAFATVFSEGAKHAVIIGTDIPSLSADHLQNAFNQLQHNDTVIGPSHDGGYYLLGMKRLFPELFENIAWSSSSVVEQTISKLLSINISYNVLPALDDIDTIEDLRSWISSEQTKDHPIKLWAKKLFIQQSVGMETRPS